MGYGDCILMMRYFPLLKKHSGCRHLVLEAPFEMETLYAEFFPDCHVVSAIPTEIGIDDKSHGHYGEINGMPYVRAFSLPVPLAPVIGWDDPVPPLPVPVPAPLRVSSRRGIGFCPSCAVAAAGRNTSASDGFRAVRTASDRAAIEPFRDYKNLPAVLS